MRAVRTRKPRELARLGRRHAVVEASAGTGKTYLLEHLVVDLLLTHDVPLDQILVVTFTEKATTELVHRVRQKIAELKDLGPGDPLARAAEGAADDETWVIDACARRKLGDALFAFDRAPIFTIHAFCQRILAENAFVQQRLFDEQVIGEEEAFAAAFAEALRRDIAPDATLAPYLTRWLESGQDLGKLRDKILRPCHQDLTRFHPPREPLRPAALDEASLQAELERFAEMPLDADGVKAWLKAHKVHASSARGVVTRLEEVQALARTVGRGASIPAYLSALDDLGRKEDVFGWLDDRVGRIPVAADAPHPADRLLAGVGAVGRRSVSLAAAVAHKLLPAVAARLETKKREAGLFDFQDMLTLVARSLDGDGPRQRGLLALLRAQYRHALVDEFQDTDEVQWHIFRRLFLEADAQHVLTVIGDPKQAIYSFRGADVHTYLGARAEIVPAGETPIYLEANHRSSDPLIRAYNALLDQSESEPFFRKDGGIHYHHPVRCGRPGQALVDGAGREQPAVVVLDLETREPMLYTWQVKLALQGRLVSEVARLLSPEGRLFLHGGEPDARRAVTARDIFVLTRTNRESREVGDALRAAGLPFGYYKLEKLFATVEAREILDLLRAIDNPDDASARARAFITAFYGLALPDLAACEQLPSDHPIVALLYRWKALADAGDFERLFAGILGQSGIVCREVFLHGSERALTNTLHLLELLQEESMRTRGTLRELIQTLGAYIQGTRKPPRMSSDMQRLETDGDAVQIMTVHQAKGLEADIVFLYGGFWPGPRGDVRVFHDETGARVVRVGRQPEAEAHLWTRERDDEERRVWYVALTRARGRLYLPRFPPAFKGLQGSYRFINDRLRALLDGFTDPAVRSLYHREPVACPDEVAAGAVIPDLAPPLSTWRPPAELLAGDGDRADAAEFAAIAASRAGFLVTSYSTVKRLQGGFVSADDPVANEPADADTSAAILPALAPGELPRGRLSGRFLHEILEELPLETLQGSPSLEAWWSRPGVQPLFERVRRRYDRQPTHLPHAARLVHTALTARVRLGDRVMAGLGAAAQLRREMEFLFPIPEAGHPSLRAPPDGDGRWTIERGVVKGFIDLLFEHQGRAYVCDWKGDWLPAWEPARITGHCQRNYTVQARLYTLATLRLLDVASAGDYENHFGGVLYCFLRGMSPREPDAGIYFHRPRWDEVVAWEEEMLSSRFWGAS